MTSSPLARFLLKGPFEDRVPPMDGIPEPGSNKSKCHRSYFRESHGSSTQASSSSVPMVHSEVKKIFLNHQEYPESERETVQFSPEKLFSTMKNKNPNALKYPFDYKCPKSSTGSQESETPTVAPFPFTELFLSRDQVRLLEENVRNQISFKSKAKLEGNIPHLHLRHQESLIQKQHPVQVDTLAHAQHFLPRHKSVKNQSFYETKFTSQGPKFVYNQTPINNQPDTKARCLRSQDMKKKPIDSIKPGSSQAQEVDSRLYLPDNSCSVESQDATKTLDSDKKSSYEGLAPAWVQDSNKRKDSTQKKATMCKDSKQHVSTVIPHVTTEGMLQLKRIKKNGQPQISSSKLRQHLPSDSAPLFPTINRQKRKGLSSITLYLINVSKPILASSKKCFRTNLVKVVLGLMICKDFLIQSLDAEKVKSSCSVKKRETLQHRRNKKGLKNVSPQISFQLEQSFTVNVQLRVPCSLLTETNWNNKEPLKDPVIPPKENEIAEFHVPSSKKLSGQHVVECETHLDKPISHLLQKLISYLKMESNRRLERMKVLKSTESSVLTSNGEMGSTSKPEVGKDPSVIQNFPFPNRKIQKDCVKAALSSVDINLLFSLGTNKHKNYEQRACIKNEESAEDMILKEKRPIMLNSTHYDCPNYGTNRNEQLECNPKSNIKNTQSQRTAETFHNVPYTTIYEHLVMKIQSELKAKKDISRIIGVNHSVQRQEEKPNEKKIYREETYRLKMPQLVGKEEEKQAILFCGVEEKVQNREEREQNPVLQHPPSLPLYLCPLADSHHNTVDMEPRLSIHEQNAPQMTQDFKLSQQLKQKVKCVQSEIQQSSVGKSRKPNEEPEVQIQMPCPQIICGTGPYLIKDPSQDEVRGDQDAATKEVLPKSLNLRVNSCPKTHKIEKHRIEQKHQLRRPSSEIIKGPPHPNHTDSGEVENMKRSLFGDSVEVRLAPWTSRQHLLPKEPLNEMGKGEVTYSGSDTREMSGRFLSTEADLSEQETHSFSETLDHCGLARSYLKTKTKRVRFLLPHCPKGANPVGLKTVTSTHLQKCSILSRKNSALNCKTKSDKIYEANGSSYDFLSVLFSPQPRQLPRDTDRFYYILSRPEKQTEKERPQYVNVFLEGDREEKVQDGQEEGKLPAPDTASQLLQLSMEGQSERHLSTPESRPGPLVWELPGKGPAVLWTDQKTILQRAPRVPDEIHAAKTENHLLVPEERKVPLPMQGNDASLNTILNTAAEDGSAAPAQPKRDLKSDILVRNTESSNALQGPFRLSSGSTKPDCLIYNKQKNTSKSARKQLFLRPGCLRPSIPHRLEARKIQNQEGHFKRKSRHFKQRKNIVNFFLYFIHSKLPLLCPIKMSSELNLETNMQNIASHDHMHLLPNGKRVFCPDSIDQSNFSNNMADGKEVKENESLTLVNSQGFLFDVYQKDYNLIKPHKEVKQPQGTNIPVQLQTHLTETTLCSASCPRWYQFPLETKESHAMILPPKFLKAKTNEIIFSAKEHDISPDANHLKEQAGSIEKEKTMSFDLSSPALSATKRKSSFKRPSDISMVANFKCGITKVKKPFISEVLHIQGGSCTKQREKLRSNSEPQMKEVAQVLNTADTTDFFGTVMSDIWINSKIDKGVKRLSSKHIKETVSPLGGDMTSCFTSFQEEQEEVSEKNILNTIQHFTFQSGQRKESDLGRSENQGNGKIVFITEQAVSQVQLIECVKLEESKTRHLSPDVMMYSGSSKLPVLKSKKSPVGEVFNGSGKDKFQRDRSLVREDNDDIMEKTEFKQDRQVSVQESTDVPGNDHLKHLLPKILASQNSDFFTHVKHIGVLEDPTAEKKNGHKRPDEILESSVLSIFSMPELKRKGCNLKLILKRNKVNPKYILLKTKKASIAQTLNITKRGAPSHTMQFKCNIKAILNQGKPMADTFLNVLLSDIPFSPDNPMKAETVWSARPNSFLSPQDQTRDGEGSLEIDFREEKTSIPENREEVKQQPGEVALQKDQPLDTNVTEVKMYYSVKSGRDFKDTFFSMGEKKSRLKARKGGLDDFFIVEKDFSAAPDESLTRKLDSHSEVSLQLEDVNKNMKTQNMFQTDKKTTLYTASGNFVCTDAYNESSGKKMGDNQDIPYTISGSSVCAYLCNRNSRNSMAGHFSKRYKELQRDELTILMRSKLPKFKRQIKALKFLERKDPMGLQNKIRKAKNPLISQILDITESSHLYRRMKQENNSASIIKGMQRKPRKARVFSFLPLTSIDNKSDTEMHKISKAELDKIKVETCDSAYQELDKLSDREASKANSTDPQKRYSNTMEINVKEEKNAPKLLSELIPHDSQYPKSKVIHIKTPGPCESESEQSSSERKATSILSCLVEKAKQEKNIRESILKSIFRHLKDHSQMERTEKCPPSQKGRKGVITIKTTFLEEQKSETYSLSETPGDGDPISENETWNQNLRTALKSLDFSSLQSPKPRGQGYSLKFRGKKNLMVPKHIILRAEKKLPVSQLPNITRCLSESHHKIKQQENECAPKASLCDAVGAELPPLRSVCDKLLLDTRTKGAQWKRINHKNAEGHLTGERAALEGTLDVTVLDPLDCCMPVLLDSKSQVNTGQISENQDILDSTCLAMKKMELSLSHIFKINGKFASKRRKHRGIHLGTSTRMSEFSQDVVEPIVNSICSALDIADTIIQNKLHKEAVVQPAQMKLPMERLLSPPSFSLMGPTARSTTMKQTQKGDIERARTTLSADLKSVNTPLPVSLTTDMNQLSGTWDVCKEFSGRVKAKVGGKRYEERILFRTALECDTQQFELGADERRELGPFESEASFIYIAHPNDITPQNMEVDIVDQEANMGTEEELSLEATPFSEMHPLEIRGWKKTDKPANSEINIIPKSEKSLMDTHFGDSTEDNCLLQERDQKEVTRPGLCLNVWSPMKDKSSSKADIPVEHPLCSEGTSLLITGDQSGNGTEEALQKAAPHSKVGQHQLCIPRQQVKSYVTSMIHGSHSTPLAKKARTGTYVSLRSMKSNKPLCISHENSVEQNVSCSQNDSYVLQYVIPTIKDTLSKVISAQRRKSGLDLFSKNQLKMLNRCGLKRTKQQTLPRQMAKQNTELPLRLDIKTSNYKEVLFPKEKKSLYGTQVVNLSIGSTLKQRMRKIMQSCKAQEEICLPKIFSFSISIYKPILTESKRQKNNRRQRLNQGIICRRRRILKLKVTEFLHLLHSIDHGTHSHREDLQLNIIEEIVDMKHQDEVKSEIFVANVSDIIHSFPHLKSNQLSRQLNTIKQEDMRKREEDPPGVKPTNLCPSFSFLSNISLNSSTPEGKSKSGISSICFPPIPSQALGNAKQTSSEEPINRGGLGNVIQSTPDFSQVKNENGGNITKTKAIMDLRCVTFKGKRTPFKHVFFEDEPQWNHREQKKLMQKDKQILDTWQKTHANISSFSLERVPGIKELYMQEITRSFLPRVIPQDVSASVRICEEPANNLESCMKKEDVSLKDEGTVERALEEMSHLDRITKNDIVSPIIQGVELIKEKEMQKERKKTEVKTKPCTSTSFPHSSEVDGRTKEVITNAISSCLCPKLQDSLKTKNISYIRSTSSDRSICAQNTNANDVIWEYEKEKTEKYRLWKKKTPAGSQKSQFAFQEREKRVEKIKSKASVVLTDHTSVSVPSHVNSCTQTRKSDFPTDITRYPLPKSSQRKASAAMKKTSNKSTQATIVDDIQKAELCTKQEKENIHIRARENMLPTKDEDSEVIFPLKPLKLQEQARGNSGSEKCARKNEKSKGEQDLTMSTHLSSDSLAVDHELAIRKGEDMQGIIRYGILSPPLQTSFDAGKILHAMSNEDDVSMDAKRVLKHKPQNGEYRERDTTIMRYLMCSNILISKANTFPQVMGTSWGCGTQIKEQTKIKENLGCVQERKIKPEKDLTKTFLPQLETTKDVNKNRRPMGYLLSSWHRRTMNEDHLIYTVSPLDEIPSCSYRVKSQEGVNRECILNKDQMNLKHRAKKSPLFSLLLTKSLQVNIKEQICSKKRGVFPNKIYSVLTSSTHLQFTLKKESTSESGIVMPPFEFREPLFSGKRAKEREQHPAEGRKTQKQGSNGPSKGTYLQTEIASPLPKCDIVEWDPLSIKNRLEIGTEEKAQPDHHRATDEQTVILTQPCASHQRWKMRIERGKDIFANTGFTSPVQLCKFPGSGKIKNPDSHLGTDMCFSTVKAGQCVSCEKAKDGVKTGGEKGRLLTSVLTLSAKTQSLRHVSPPKISPLNAVWQRRERQKGRGNLEEIQSEFFSLLPNHSSVNGDSRKKREEELLAGTKPSSPPLTGQDPHKSLVDYRLKERLKMEDKKMPHKCMDLRGGKSPQAWMCNYKKFLWKIKESKKMVGESKYKLVMSPKNMGVMLVTLPSVKLGSSEEGRYTARTKLLHPSHLRTEAFAGTTKIAHRAIVNQEPHISINESKEPTLQKDMAAREKDLALNTMADSNEMCLKSKESLSSLRSSQRNIQETETQEQRITEGQQDLSDDRLTNLDASQSPPISQRVDIGHKGESIEIVTRFSIATVKLKESLESKEAIHLVPVSFDVLIYPLTRLQSVAQGNAGDGVEPGLLLSSKHQEEKVKEGQGEPKESLTQSYLSAFSLSPLHLDNKRQEDDILVHKKTVMQKISSVEEKPPTELIIPSNLEGVSIGKEQKSQEQSNSQENTTDGKSRMMRTQVACKLRNSQHPYVYHRTEMHLNIGGREQRRREDQSQPCSKALRKNCVSGPSPLNLNLDKGTQVDVEMLGIQRPFTQPIVLLALTEKTQEAKGDGRNKNEQFGSQREKQHEVLAVDLRVKMQPELSRGSPISQILDSKEFVLNLIEQKKKVHGDREELCRVLTRNFISIPTVPTFVKNLGNKIDKDVPEKKRVFFPRCNHQQSSDVQERAIGKSLERESAIVVKKAKHPAKRQEAAGKQASHFQISIREKNLPPVRSEEELNQLILSPQSKKSYFTGCGSISNGEGLEHSRINTQLEDPSEAHRTPPSAALLSHPTQMLRTVDNWKKDLKIKGTFDQKINPKDLFASLIKMPLELCITCSSPANSKGFSVLESEPQDSPFKASPGQAKSYQGPTTKKDGQSHSRMSKIVHPCAEGSLGKMSITGSSATPCMNPQIILKQMGLLQKREVKSSLARVSSLYLKFPLQCGKQMTFSTMAVDMRTVGYPRRQELCGMHSNIIESAAHRTKGQPALLGPEKKQFILESLRSSICPCQSLSLGPANLERRNEGNNKGTWKQDRSKTRKPLAQKAPSGLTPYKHKKEAKVLGAEQNIQSQKKFTKRVPGSPEPALPLSPKCEDLEGRFTREHVKWNSTPQCFTMKIPNHPILQLLGHVKKLEFESVQPKEITLWDENGTEIYHGNLYLSREPALQAEETKGAKRDQEKEKSSCTLEPQKSVCTNRTVWKIRLTNSLPRDTQTLEMHTQNTQNNPGAASEADSSSRENKVPLTPHMEEGAISGHDVLVLPTDPMVQQQEENVAKPIPFTPEKPKEAVEMPAKDWPVSPTGAAENQGEVQPVLTQDTNPEQPQKPQSLVETMTLPPLQAEGKERKLADWRNPEENLLPIVESIRNYLESQISNIIQEKFLPQLESRSTCPQGAWKSPPSTEAPDPAPQPEPREQAKAISECSTPQGEMKPQRHLVLNTQEIHSNGSPQKVRQSSQSCSLSSKEKVASEDVPRMDSPAPRKASCVPDEDTETIEISLRHKSPRGAALVNPLKSLNIHFADTDSKVLKWSCTRKLESRACFMVASDIQRSWPPILRRCPIELRDKLLIHLGRKTLEIQMKTFPRPARASYIAAHNQQKKPMSQRLSPGHQGPKHPNRTILLLDQKSLHPKDLDLRYKHARFFQQIPVKTRFPKPKTLSKYTLKLNTFVTCKNINRHVQDVGLTPDREQEEKQFSFRNRRPQQSQILGLPPVAELDPDGSNGEERDIIAPQELTHPVTMEKDKHGNVWSQRTALCPCLRPQKNAGDSVQFQATRPPEVFLKRGLKASAASQPSLSPKDSEKCMVLEANSHLVQESESILYELQNGVPLENLMMKKINTDMTPFVRETLSPFQLWACRRHSLAVTPPHWESHRNRKQRPSSRRNFPGQGSGRPINTPEASWKSSIIFLQEKCLPTMRNKMNHSVAPLTKSNLRLHLARNQGRPSGSPESRERKKAKSDIFCKNHSPQNQDHSNMPHQGKYHRKKPALDCSNVPEHSGTFHYFSCRKNLVWKPYQEAPQQCWERRTHPPFVYACIPADSLEIIPQTVRWTIPPQTLRKNNFRVPLVAKVYSSCSLGCYAKKC